jgi:hypothetical protein
MFIACHHFRFCNSTFNTIGDKGERCIFIFFDPFLRNGMGHDENWNALVIVASSKTDPRTIALSGDAEKDSQVIEAEARRCFELIRKA